MCLIGGAPTLTIGVGRQMKRAMEANSHDLGSRSASLACRRLKSLLSCVARSRASRSTATLRSGSLRNQALDGSWGMKTMKRTPATMVRPPQTINMTRHLSNDMLESPMAYMRRPPRIWDTPNMETHTLVFHISQRVGRLLVRCAQGTSYLRYADWVLPFLVPRAGYYHERRRHGTLRETQEEADGSDTGEVLGGGQARRYCSP